MTPTPVRRLVRAVSRATLRKRLTAVAVLTFAIFALSIDMGGLWGVVLALYGTAGAVAASWLAWVTAPPQDDPPDPGRPRPTGRSQAGRSQISGV